MSAQNSIRQLWHAGVIFSGAGGVVYPQLPTPTPMPTPTPTPTFSSMVAAARNPHQDLDPASQGGLEAHDRPSVPGRNGQNDAWPRKDGAPKTSHHHAASPSLQPASRPAAGEKGADLFPPDTSLDFKMPAELFRNAKAATPGSPESFWNYSLYRGPGETPGSDADTKVKVHYCKSLQTTERVLQQYFVGEKLLGFDLEWKSDATVNHGARWNVSLVQLASPSRVALLHLAVFPKNSALVAPSFKKMMENPEVTKCGVWIKGDCKRIRKYLGIDARGTFELSHLYKLVKHSTDRDYQLVNKKLVAMATQVQECLGLPLFKGHDVRASDWSKSLQMDQVLCKPGIGRRNVVCSANQSCCRLGV